MTDLTPQVPQKPDNDNYNPHTDCNNPVVADVASASASAAVAPEDSGRERLKRHRVAVAGQVWIPEKWGKEEFLKDWIDGSAFEASLFPSGVVSARLALVREGKRSSPPNSAAATAAAAAGALRILNSFT